MPLAHDELQEAPGVPGRSQAGASAVLGRDPGVRRPAERGQATQLEEIESVIAGTWTPPGAEAAAPGEEPMATLAPLELTAEGIDPGTAVQGQATFDIKEGLRNSG